MCVRSSALSCSAPGTVHQALPTPDSHFILPLPSCHWLLKPWEKSWPNKGENLPPSLMAVAFPQQGQGLSAEHTGGIWHGNRRMWNRDGQYLLLVPAFLALKSLFTVCKAHHFAKLRKRFGIGNHNNSKSSLNGSWPRFPFPRWKEPLTSLGQKAGRTKAKPQNLLCFVRREIFPKGEIQSIFCNFLTIHESLQLCRDSSSFPIQLLN